MQCPYVGVGILGNKTQALINGISSSHTVVGRFLYQEPVSGTPGDNKRRVCIAAARRSWDLNNVGTGLKAGVAEEARIRGFATPAFAGCALSVYWREYIAWRYITQSYGVNRLWTWRSC